jgi:FdhD protein
MEIRLDDHLVATTMRTPGHDFELAVGFCHGDGLLVDAKGGPVAVETVRYCETGTAVETGFNVVSVSTAAAAAVPVARLGLVGSSCGLCGSASIETVSARLGALGAPSMPVRTEVLHAVGDRVRRGQELFEVTGGVHAAAAFGLTDGDVTVIREDIGRHNAVDKVVGRLLLDDAVPATERGLWVSGRASFEMVVKAWGAGFGVLVSVSAPSALAVSTAAAAGVVLVGFARDGRLTVYCGADSVRS